MVRLITDNDTEISLSFLWMEITGKCQLRCIHCYAGSNPQGDHGVMTDDDWRRIIDEAATLGVRMVRFIGGEPTLHPSFSDFVGHALQRGLVVEVFSNLLHITQQLWSVFSLPGVHLATSYYADHAGQHEMITARRDSHLKTMTNIAEAVRRSIPLRVGLINVMDGQRLNQAHAQLATLGVTNIGTDRVRQVDRGVRDRKPDITELCGGCARDKVAIARNGEVWPCVFARWMSMGNVRSTPLAKIVAASKIKEVHGRLGYGDDSRCAPKNQCEPAKNDYQPHCPPGYHSDPKKCWPYYYEE
jgi:MoaA/NifB/PqqE/SkfB family radical SAM enzyme